MTYAIFMGILFLASLSFVGILVGAVVWHGVSWVIKRIKAGVLDALDIVQIFRA